MDSKLDSYYTYLNQNLLDSLPSGLNRVLDVGCGGGMLGAAYKTKNPDCVWHGIDHHKGAIELAKQQLDGAWKMDAEAIKPTAAMKSEKYDALVYGCTLEQLNNPKAALLSHLELLADHGQIIACFANVQNWTVMRHVISGNWNYGDRGLLHRDNRVLFTRKSFNLMLDECGLVRTDLKRFSYENDPLFRQRKKDRLTTIAQLKAFCDVCQLDYKEYDFRTYHYVMSATRK